MVLGSVRDEFLLKAVHTMHKANRGAEGLYPRLHNTLQGVSLRIVKRGPLRKIEPDCFLSDRAISRFSHIKA